MTRLMLRVAFGGEFGDPEYELTKAKGEEWEQILDVDAAAAELRRAGYEVFRMPEKYGGLLAHPLDDFIEAHTHIEGADNDKVIDALWNEVDAIVSKFGGLCWECGPIEPDHVPFADLFPDPEGLTRTGA